MGFESFHLKLQSSNIEMENGPFEDVCPIKKQELLHCQQNLLEEIYIVISRNVPSRTRQLWKMTKI